MIFTFYSYKGGVGRSMALANVAQWLYLQGLRVVMIDWDLEAPGLENFFYASVDDLERVRSQPGVIDILTAYQREFPHLALDPAGTSYEHLDGAIREHLPALRDFLHTIRKPGELASHPSAGIWLLPSGWRAADRFSAYAETVQSFDWLEFYQRFQGKEYLEWFRRTIDTPDVCDVVLIDSRTGVTEMGGVCTRELADVVVAFCAPNLGNLTGTVTIASSFQRDQLLEARCFRPIQTLIVPTRIENTELERKNAFREQFEAAVQEFTPPTFRDSNRTFWSLQIPYVPHYAYREALVVGVAGGDEHLEAAYKNLTAHLAALTPAGSAIHEKCEAELVRLLSWKQVLTDVPALSASQAVTLASQEAGHVFERLSVEDRRAALRLFSRLVRVEVTQTADGQRPVHVSRLPQDAAAVLPRFVDAGLLSLSTDAGAGDPLVQAVAQFPVASWQPVREWVHTHRDFLLWRQRLEASVDLWLQTHRDAGALLRGAPLKEAQKIASDPLADLNELERAYVEASTTAEEQATASQYAVEQRESERSRARQRLRSSLLAAAALVAIVVLGFVWRDRTDNYQVARTIDEGQQLARRLAALPDQREGDRTGYSPRLLSDWCSAMVLTAEYDHARSAAAAVVSPVQRPAALARVALFLATANQHEAAGQMAATVVTESEGLHDTHTARAGIAETLLAAGRHKEAAAVAQRAVRGFRESDEPYDGLLLAQLAAVISTSDTGAAIAAAHDGIAIARRADASDAAAVLSEMSVILAAAKLESVAMTAAVVAVAQAEAAGGESGVGMGRRLQTVSALGRAGGVLAHGKESQRAARAVRRALELAGLSDDPFERATLHAAIGEVLARGRLHQEAIKAADIGVVAALSLTEQYDYGFEIQSSILDRAAVALGAAGATDKAIEVAKQIKDRTKAAFALARIAEQLSEQNSPQLASTTEAAIQAAEQIEDAHRKTDVYIRLAQVLRKAGRLDQAAEAARVGLKIAADVPDQAEKQLDVVRLANVLRGLGSQNEVEQARNVILAQAEVLRVETQMAGTPDKRSDAVARTAEALADLGEFRAARALAEMVSDSERLRVFEAIVFEHARHRNAALATSLEQLRQRDGSTR